MAPVGIFGLESGEFISQAATEAEAAEAQAIIGVGGRYVSEMCEVESRLVVVVDKFCVVRLWLSR